MKKLLENLILDKKKPEMEFSVMELECLENADFITDDENSDLEDEELILIEKAQEGLEEEFDQQDLKRSRCKSVNIKKKKMVNSYKPNHINLFKNQNIQQIRTRNKPFIDPYFPRNLNVIIETSSKEDIKDILCQEFQVVNRMNYAELNSKIRWKRPQAICYGLRIGRYEFVLDNNGKGLGTNFTEADFGKCLSSNDIFQGMLGDCFMLATFLSICSNKELMAYVIPKDNAYRKNMKIGAYHFRLWKLGEWYDVVIDDYLPLDSRHSPLFVKNKKYNNEFWICLFEKCIAK